MTTNFTNISKYSRFNLSESVSDIQILVNEYEKRIQHELLEKEETLKTPFISFANHRLSIIDVAWLQDNDERFFRDTANDSLIKQNYLSACGYICCMIYSEDGCHVILGHSSGLIQKQHKRAQPDSTGQKTSIFVGFSEPHKSSWPANMDEQKQILREYIKSIHNSYENERIPKLWYPMFYAGKLGKRDAFAWIRENEDRFLKGTPNEIVYNRWYFSEMGFVTALEFAPNGAHIIVGHSSGLIQMRHGGTGTVMCTLRNIQFPPTPIYSLAYSKTEDRVCYAASMDGHVYRIEIPQLASSVNDPPQYCIRVDPALECLHMQFYGSPGIASYATSFVSQRSPALSLGLTADQTKMVVGYGDTSIKVYDMETQEVDITYKVHKLRLQFIPKKLQRMHFGQVCALKCHPQKPYMFASGAWDKTLRIWDIRCKVGCVMTFEGVDICSDSIDLNRDHCLVGSWQPAEALTVWDLTAKKRLSVVRAQNRRPDVDGEYIYACRYWRSSDFNRKGKYAVIGGSGTNAVEVINLHNRYISCSYPAVGTVLAVASHQDRVAFGGTATTFNIVKFYDPKHEKDKYRKEDPDFDYSKTASVFDASELDRNSESSVETGNHSDTAASGKSAATSDPSRKSKVAT